MNHYVGLKSKYVCEVDLNKLIVYLILFGLLITDNLYKKMLIIDEIFLNISC